MTLVVLAPAQRHTVEVVHTSGDRPRRPGAEQSYVPSCRETLLSQVLLESCFGSVIRRMLKEHTIHKLPMIDLPGHKHVAMLHLLGKRRHKFMEVLIYMP